jgi:hypothetical protein
MVRKEPPPRITIRLGQVVIPHHVGRLEVFVIDRIMLLNERQRGLVVEVLPLASHLLIRLGE